jgi:glycosyltransferase involved in cell wall biosynthesis
MQKQSKATITCSDREKIGRGWLFRLSPSMGFAPARTVETMAHITAIETYSFTPDDLKVADRKPGLSAFVRTKNGADFIAPTIRSHAPYVDEIVAVFNQCTDATEEILAGLQDELGPDKLKLFHYLPRVHPPGSSEHAAEPGASPHSVVNYSNFALAQTTRRIVVKLDDDHIAFDRLLAPMVADLRREGLAPGRMNCFSGLNLARDEDGSVGVHVGTPFSGNGDIGFFAMTPDAYFVHDRRFEDFRKYHFDRVFAGFAYWHMKYLKSGLGFANYEIGEGRNRRFARKEKDFHKRREVVTVAELRDSLPRLKATVMSRIPFDKWALIGNRALAILAGAVTDQDVADVIAQYGLGEPVTPE